MKTPSLFGSLVAALLIASPGIALAQNNSSGGNGNHANGGNTGAFGNTGYRGEYGNGGGNGAGMNSRLAYSNIGQGGFTGRVMPIRTGNNGGNGNGGWFGNNGNNGNNGGNGNNGANMRPSQRNHLLADNGDVRASKMIGNGVFNDRNNQIGSVNDVLIGQNGVWAIVSTNNKKVAVPFRDFVFGNGNANGHDTLVLPHVTQAELNRQPVFHYNLNNYRQNNGNNGGGWFSNNNTGRGYAGNTNNGGWLGAHGGGVNGGNNGGNNGNGNNG